MMKTTSNFILCLFFGMFSALLILLGTLSGFSFPGLLLTSAVLVIGFLLHTHYKKWAKTHHYRILMTLEYLGNLMIALAFQIYRSHPVYLALILFFSIALVLELVKCFLKDERRKNA